MWQISYSETALAFLEKLDKPQKERIYSKLKETKQDPPRFFSRMVSLPLYKMRVGDYRIIADLREQVKIVSVIRIGHRKNIYESL